MGEDGREGNSHPSHGSQKSRKSTFGSQANPFIISNLDTVIIAEQPVFSPFKKQIQAKIASVLNINEGSVNVKAKTNEGLGAIGRCEAIAAYAAAIISKED